MHCLSKTAPIPRTALQHSSCRAILLKRQNPTNKNLLLWGKETAERWMWSPPSVEGGLQDWKMAKKPSLHGIFPIWIDSSIFLQQLNQPYQCQMLRILSCHLYRIGRFHQFLSLFYSFCIT